MGRARRVRWEGVGAGGGADATGGADSEHARRAGGEGAAPDRAAAQNAANPAAADAGLGASNASNFGGAGANMDYVSQGMLGDADAERIAATGPSVSSSSIGARRVVGEIRERVVVAVGAASAAAEKDRSMGVRKRPFLTSLAGFGGRRAKVDDSNRGRGPASATSDPIATRTVYINDDDANSHFLSNYVSTTKYSLWSALPMFLYEQFTRFSNAYFLVVGILYSIDAITPIFTVGRYASLWVLAVVVAISGIKEGIEDYHRYREDRRVNRAVAHVVGSSLPEDRWDTVKVGDVIKVFEKEHLPADIVLVASSNDEGLAFIETKQLDGESNLKVKVVPQATSSAFEDESTALLTKGHIECETPNDRLYKFHGRMILSSIPRTAAVSNDVDDHGSHSSSDDVGARGQSGDGDDTSGTTAALKLTDPLPLGPENLLIRGSSVRNTEWVMGIVVNTGRDTKLMQNVKPRPRKNSRLERETNRHYFITLLLQVCIVVALTARSSQLCEHLFVENFAWYLLEKDGCEKVDSFLRFFTFFVTFSALIPISLYVSMEIVRGFQVYFIMRDQHICDHTTGVNTEVRTSNLNEELGVVHYVFTDKTGTLTANRMEFKKCSIANRVYEWADIASSGTTTMRELQKALEAGPESSAVRNFSVEELEAADDALRLLAVCHSVVAEVVSVRPAGASDAESLVDDGTNEGRRGALRRRRRRMRARRSGSETQSERTDTDFSSRATSALSSLVGFGGGTHAAAASSGILPDMDSGAESAGLPSLVGVEGAEASGDISIHYQASSPDEAALVQAAKSHGYTFMSRSNRDTVISVFGRTEHHELLEVIEFDSTRKRMSIISRGADGRVRIYTKGADAVIFARLAPGQSADITEQHLHDFAVEGLRTLCLAYADLDEGWFQEWHRRYREASSQIANREEAIERITDEIERNLTLIGATAIEDKLQEGVPETLKKLEQAGIKVWVLTGDKQETAINIGLSCGAIDEGMDVVIINENNLEDTAAQIDRALGRWGAIRQDPSMEGKLGLVIDGQTLHFALKPELQKKLIVLSRLARSVIACRVSPKQKTELVELVRRHEKDKVTLAIGDGANDVGMIQAAHVGVGIVGLEGQEAKLASDYSIGQFRFLARLMLVHGRWSYKRLSKMVLYTIYKNAALTLCELYWATHTAFSGQPLLDPWMGGLYNLFLTSLPPVVLGILDQELTADYALAFPEIYLKGQRNSAYSFRVFASWLLSAVWQSAIVFYMSVWAFGDKAGANGQLLGMWPFGVVVFSAIIVTVHAMLLVFQSSWTRLTFGMFILSLSTWFIIGPIFSWRVIALQGNLSPPLYAVVHRVMAEPRFWLLLLLCPVICVSPSLLWKYSKRRRRPDMKMLVQELIRSGKTREEITGQLPKALRRVPSYDPSAPTTPSGPVTFVVNGEREYLFSGFNFDNDESSAVLRHAFPTSRRVRRKRMRVLKRAGSDTELDVEGVKTAMVESPQPARRGTDASVWPRDWVPGDVPGDGQRRRRRPERYPRQAGGTSPLNLPGSIPSGQGGSGPTAAHRRAMSDGAVLVETRYARLSEQHHGEDTDDSSDDDTRFR